MRRVFLFCFAKLCSLLPSGAGGFACFSAATKFAKKIEFDGVGGGRLDK